MSLVSEALRKARTGSPDPGAHRHGVVYRTTVVLGETRRRGRGWAMLAAVVVAAAAGGTAAWWLLDRGAARPAVTPRIEAAAAARPVKPAATPLTASAPAAAPSTAAGAVPAAPPAPKAAAQAAPAPATPQPPPVAGAEHRHVLTALEAPAAPAAAVARPAERPASPPAEQPAAPPPAGGVRTFGLDADLGYAKLHLDYIVYRSKDPFAGVNGQQVMIGSIIAGFTVEEIGPDSIRLHDPRGDVVLQIPR